MRKSWLMVLCAFAGCGEGEAGGDAGSEMSELDALAARHACVSETLLATAQEDLQTLSSGMGGGSATPSGVTTFARAFLQHAQLRHTVYALTDSAYNHASDAADSVRYEQLGDGFEIIAPEVGTVEGNVMQNYDQKASEMLADTDHVCNWRHEVSE